MATISADETYAVMLPPVYTPDAKLVERSRLKTTDPWSEPRVIGSLSAEVGVKSPCLNAEGTMLVFQRKRSAAQYPGKDTEFAFCMRPARGQQWGPPTTLPMAPDPMLTDTLTWPCPSPDALHLAFCHGGTRNAVIMLADRPAHGLQFRNYRTVVVDGQPLTGRAPRYLPAVQSLYFSRDADPNVKDSGIYVVTGVPDPLAGGAAP
jgi:hypothetical protein